MLLNNSEADPGHGPTALGTPLIVKKLLIKGIIFLFHFSFNLVLFPFLSLSLAGAWNDTVLLKGMFFSLPVVLLLYPPPPFSSISLADAPRQFRG